MDLPDNVKHAVEMETSALSPKQLSRLASVLSDRYRADKPSTGKGFLKTKEDVDVYAVYRLPATFAAAYAVLNQIRECKPAWSPKTLLDAGAGPGTVMWAVTEVYPELEAITLLERDEHMISLGQRLANHSVSLPVQKATWVHSDVTENRDISSHDMVAASYVLGELKDQQRAAFIHHLWQITADTLVIIEPGTPAGFARIRQARDQLIAEGGIAIAPCPHDLPCPMPENDWCHFSQRIARSRLHRQVKEGELSYEDEKFSFIAVSRKSGKRIPGRVLRHPQVRKGHILFEICTPDGLRTRTVTRKEIERYRNAKRLGWGSVFLSDSHEKP